MFSENDLKQLRAKGISEQEIQSQLNLFNDGLKFMNVVRPATVGDGIKSLTDDAMEAAVGLFDKESGKYSMSKFVPASGAATRMFKDLYEFMENYSASNEDYLKYLSNRSSESVYFFFENLHYFAFYEDLRDLLEEKYQMDIDRLLEKNEFSMILKALISDEGLNYGKMPKGLIKFHNYRDFSRSAAEEHMLEAKLFIESKKKIVKLHFTVADEFMTAFKAHIAEVAHIHQEKYHVKYDISYSTQDQSTDTIAVDMNNEPFRNEKGKLVFRPGGHGSLINNLNNLSEDIIFIKNIDNIVPDRLKPESAKYKKVLGGLLIKYQQQIFNYLQSLDEAEVSEQMMTKIQKCVLNELHIKLPVDFAGLAKDEKIKVFKSLLNRPIRVCGMVVNEGEPGGGPFFVRNPDGIESLQIVESSQIDLKDAKIDKIIQKSSHFNPVDLVCGIKDYKGKKFDLLKYVDKDAAFISCKSSNGRELKALEWPGLWNGAMSNWNTVFVEVPAVTFNPVKTVNDLLREEHTTLAYLSTRKW